MYLRRAAFEELQAAIRRIDDQRYGICAECGRTITFDHLRLRPQTVRCAECSRPTSTEP
jgi:RNA polymerase-binding transcription factor DksA